MSVGLIGVGVVSGFLSMVLAMIAGHSVVLAMALYPLVGSITVLALAVLVYLRHKLKLQRQMRRAPPVSSQSHHLA